MNQTWITQSSIKSIPREWGFVWHQNPASSVQCSECYIAQCSKIHNESPKSHKVFLEQGITRPLFSLGGLGTVYNILAPKARGDMKVGALWLEVGHCNRIQNFLYDFSQYFTILNPLCNAFPFHTIHSHLFGSSLLFSAFSKTFQKRIYCVAMNTVCVCIYISHIYNTSVYYYWTKSCTQS